MHVLLLLLPPVAAACSVMTADLQQPQCYVWEAVQQTG